MVKLGPLTEEYDAREYLYGVDARRALLAYMWDAGWGTGATPRPMPCWDDVETIKELHRLLHIPERPQEWPWIVGGVICGLITGLFVLVCFVLYYGGIVG